MKVLFLDIDGVLNKRSDAEVVGNPNPYHRLNWLLLETLKRIIKETGCKVVISSTWRKDGGIDFFKSVSEIEVFGTTPIHSNGHRGNEIKEFIDDNGGIETYAIVDDDSDMRDDQLPNFFQTDPEYGLTETLAYRITRHLGEASNDVISYYRK
jgi:hypothetical protein